MVKKPCFLDEKSCTQIAPNNVIGRWSKSTTTARVQRVARDATDGELRLENGARLAPDDIVALRALKATKSETSDSGTG